jgi:hypothetical protein
MITVINNLFLILHQLLLNNCLHKILASNIINAYHQFKSFLHLPQAIEVLQEHIQQQQQQHHLPRFPVPTTPQSAELI